VTPIEETAMSVHALKPWTELVKLHADVESGSLAQSVFAIDLGAVATGDPTTPKVYRDPNAFFAATPKGTTFRVSRGRHRRPVPLAPLRAKCGTGVAAAVEVVGGNRVMVGDPCATFS
jgi:hypothetical protein